MNMKTEEILLRTSLQDCREKYDKLVLQYYELAAALVAKDEALRDYSNATGLYVQALQLQPHAALINKIKADAVLKFFDRYRKDDFAHIHNLEAEHYAQRIEQGEA